MYYNDYIVNQLMKKLINIIKTNNKSIKELFFNEILHLINRKEVLL